MTNKIFSKTVKKTTIFSVIIALLLAAAIAVVCFLGFNKSVLIDSNKSLTVSVNTFSYNNNKEEIKETCEKTFNGAGVSAEYVIEGEMDGDTCEFVFVFDKDVNVENLADGVKTALKASFAEASINVSDAVEEATAVLAKHFVLRAAIAAAVFTVLAFAYVAIRYRSVYTGVAVGLNVLFAMALTAGIIVLTRIPVTVSVASVIMIGGLLAAACTLLTVGKAEDAKKEDGDESNEARTLSAIATKETLWLCCGLAFAMVLVGVLGKTAAAWFAVAALVAIVVAAILSLFYAPALYLSMQEVESRKSKSGYVGAKKSEKKEKASIEASKEEAPVVAEEAPEEKAPVEEAAEEAPVEEASAEEVPSEEEEDAQA